MAPKSDTLSFDTFLTMMKDMEERLQKSIGEVKSDVKNLDVKFDTLALKVWELETNYEEHNYFWKVVLAVWAFIMAFITFNWAWVLSLFAWVK